MGRTSRNAAMVGLLIGTLLGPWGCATKSHRVPTLSEEVRAEIGTLGVAASGIVPTSDLKSPTGGKGSGAAKGAGLAAGAMASEKPPFGLVLAPVAALGGAIYGAIVAPSAQKVKEAETALASAFADLKVQEAIHAHALQAARGLVGYRVVPLGDTPDVDAILEIGVVSVKLAGAAALDIDPPLQLVILACPRLVRRADGRELYPAEPTTPAVVHMSAPRKFIEWGGQDARLFREEMERAYQNLAERAVEEMFLAFHPPGSRWWSRDPASGRTCRPAGAEVKR
jgi:hypothetical protein